MDNASDKVSGGQKPAIRMLLKVLASVFVFALLLPFVLGKTSLRDFVLNSLVDSDKLTLQSTDASLGYFSPTSVSGLKLQTIDMQSGRGTRMIGPIVGRFLPPPEKTQLFGIVLPSPGPPRTF